SVIEQYDRLCSQIDQQSAEPAIQLLYEVQSDRLIESYQVLGTMLFDPTCCEPGPPYFICGAEIFSRKDQANIVTFVPQRNAIGKRSAMTYPADAKPNIFVCIRTRDVGRLVHHGSRHCLDVCVLDASLADDPRYTGHVGPLCRQRSKRSGL